MSDKIRKAFEAWIASVDKRRDANGREPLTARDVNMLREGYMEAAIAEQPGTVAVPRELLERMRSFSRRKSLGAGSRGDMLEKELRTLLAGGAA